MEAKEIKYGSIQYFTLHRLNDQLKSRDFERLALDRFESLKIEVETKIREIDYIEKHKNDCSECDGTGIIDNSFMTCLGCNGTGKQLTNPSRKAT